MAVALAGLPVEVATAGVEPAAVRIYSTGNEHWSRHHQAQEELPPREHARVIG
jgi:hypothetical protein